MNELGSWIAHQDRQIFFLDLSGVSVADLSARLMGLESAHHAIREAGSVLVLTDVRESAFNAEAIRSLTDFVRKNKPYVQASAIIGVSGIKRSIIATIAVMTGRRLGLFETREAALQWLVESALESG